MSLTIREAHEETRAAWEANAAFWDQQMGEGNDFVEVLIWPPTKRLIEVQSGQRVLDVGCGNGLYARRLAELGAEVLAFDFSANMIAHARARESAHPEKIEYRVIDATDENALLALGEGQYHSAMCSMALFDMAEIDPLMRGLAKLLRPEGRFVLSVIHPCFNSPHVVTMAEREDRGGELLTQYSVKVRGYMSPTIERGLAIRGQPKPQVYFHRPLHVLLGSAFGAGFVLDALEERAFPVDHEPSKDPLSWGAHFSEIPPVLVARLRAPV